MNQFNVFIERRFSVINEGALVMLLNVKFNDTAQKMLQAEAAHTCKRVHNSIIKTGRTNSPIEFFYGERPKNIGLLSYFGPIEYVKKREKVKRQTKVNMYKEIMVQYADNHNVDT